MQKTLYCFIIFHFLIFFLVDSNLCLDEQIRIKNSTKVNILILQVYQRKCPWFVHFFYIHTYMLRELSCTVSFPHSHYIFI